MTTGTRGVRIGRLARAMSAVGACAPAVAGCKANTQASWEQWRAGSALV
ncbi:hypothetical protein ACFVYG_15590 [Streptomyces sp. NPDC058256]